VNIFRGRSRLSVVAAAVVASAIGFVAAPTNAAPATQAYIVVVNGDRAVDIVANHFDSTGVDIKSAMKGSIDFVVAALDSHQRAELEERPGVRSIAPDFRISLASEQQIGESQSEYNWGLDRIDQPTSTLDRRFRYAADGTGVKIYILDTGIRRTHTEFVGRVLAGRNTISPGAAPDDDCGHGTHVAGIAAGSTYGVAKKATLVPVKIFPGGSREICDGGTTVSEFLEGMNWVIADHQPNEPAVVNLSLGTAVHSGDLDQVVRNAVLDGIVVVGAAGNDGNDPAKGYIDASLAQTAPSPACSSRYSTRTEGILTVGATGGFVGTTFTREDDEASYSNYGPCVDIFAPGTNIKSAWPVAGSFDLNNPDLFSGNYSDTGSYNKSGTSMASPFVAGAAAMLLQQTPTATPAEVTSRILANATPNAVSIIARGATASPNLLLYTCASNCVPSAPKNVTVARASRTEINVTWEAPESNGGLEVTSYDATASATGATPAACSATVPTLTCKLSGLTAGTTYSITVAAKNSAGSGASSAAKTLAAGAAPGAPGTPTTVAGNGEVKVTWTAPTDNGGLAISKYTVTSSPDSKTCSPVATEVTCVVTGLTVGTKYTFTVTATNDAGSAVSAASASVVPALPWEYVPVFAAVVPGNKKVDLQWTEARVLGTAPSGYFTGYVVKDATGAVVCTTTELKCSVRNLKNATKVSYSVAATTIADTSQVATSNDVIVGGVRQLANAMRKRTSASLIKIATTNSKGKVTWRSLSGGCRITRGIVTAPATGKACKLRISVAKSGAFPAQTLTVSVQLL